MILIPVSVLGGLAMYYILDEWYKQRYSSENSWRKPFGRTRRRWRITLRWFFGREDIRTEAGWKWRRIKFQ
jgi:hypothetical protein